MREDSPLGRIAFVLVTALAAVWAIGGVGAILLGVIAQPATFWPFLILFAPITLAVIAVAVDRMRSDEDRRYSRDVQE